MADEATAVETAADGAEEAKDGAKDESKDESKDGVEQSAPPQPPPEIKGVMEIDESDVEEVSNENTYEIEMSEELADEETGPSADDPERLEREKEPYPPLYKQESTSDLSGARAKALSRKLAKLEQEATSALASGDVPGAIKKYSESMQTGGATALLLATRGLLLLKQRRPCAAIRDCTAAIKLNSLIGKAYRVRGIAHRRLGNWKKAHRDLAEAQRLNFDTGTAEMQRFVAEKLGIKDTSRKRGPEVLGESATEKRKAQPYGSAVETAPAAPPVAAPAPSISEPPKWEPPKRPSPTDLVANAMVRIQGLRNAPYLNGKRGVVQRQDPHPTRRGRWEVELRLDGGRMEVKSMKEENILAIHAADKAGLKLWKQQEREHVQERKRIEEAAKKVAATATAAPSTESAPQAEPQVEESPAAPAPAAEEEPAPVDEPMEQAPDQEESTPNTPEEALAARLLSMKDVEEKTRALMQRLPVDKATDLLEKAEKMAQDISMNKYLSNQAKLALDLDSSEDEQA